MERVLRLELDLGGVEYGALTRLKLGASGRTTLKLTPNPLVSTLMHRLTETDPYALTLIIISPGVNWADGGTTTPLILPFLFTQPNAEVQGSFKLLELLQAGQHGERGDACTLLNFT